MPDTPTWAWIAGVLLTIVIAGGGLWMKIIHISLRDMQQTTLPRIEKTLGHHAERLATREQAHVGLSELMNRLSIQMTSMEQKLDRVLERERRG